MIHSLLILFLCCVATHGKHFNGGIIDWKPIDPYSNSSIVPITITQSYSWTASIINCSTNIPTTSDGRSGENLNLTCVADCSTDGGYSLKPIDILTDCQSVSSSLDLMTSQRSVSINLTADAHFYLSYGYLAWIALDYPKKTGLAWSMVVSIDLRMRPDGFINTPPVTSVVSPQFAIVNRTTLITIPVSDVNAGDSVRCRWSVNTPIDECGGICYPNTVPVNTNLSNCTISFIATVPNTWYAVAIQVEDFINDTSVTPMSSVPAQFLIYVMNQTQCGVAPVILPLQRCLDVQVGVPISFNISAMTLCDPIVSDIDSITVSSGIPGMSISNTSHLATNASVSYATFTWTPVVDLLGSQQLCVYAYSYEKLQSPQYCVTFNVVGSSAICLTTTTTTTTTTSTTATTTTSTTTTTVTSTTTRTTTTTSTSATTATTTSTTTRTTTSTTSETTTSTTTHTTTSTTTATTTSTTTHTTTSVTTTTTTSTTTQTTTSVTTTSTTSQTTTSVTTTSTTTATTTSTVTTTSTSQGTTTTTTTISTPAITTTTASTISGTSTTTSITSTITTVFGAATATISATSHQTTDSGSQLSLLSIAIVIALSALLAACCCWCCLYWLCWSSDGRRSGQFESDERAQEEAAVGEIPPPTIPRHPFWIPVFSIHIPRINYARMSSVSPFMSTKPVFNPSSTKTKRIIINMAKK